MQTVVFFLTLSLFLGGQAFAESLAAKEVSETFLNACITFLGALLSALAGIGIRLVHNKVKLVKNEEFSNTLRIISELAFTKVAEINAKTIDQLRASAEDGKLTKEEAADALNTACREVWSGLPYFIQQNLLKDYGSEGPAIDHLIAPAVEQSVVSQKKA